MSNYKNFGTKGFLQEMANKDKGVYEDEIQRQGMSTIHQQIALIEKNDRQNVACTTAV